MILHYHHTTWRRFVYVALFAVLAAVANGNIALAQDETVIRIDPPEFTIGQGQIETVNVVIENVKNLYGGEVHLKFDPTVVEIVDSDPTRDGVQIIPGDFPKPEFVAVNKADNKAGTIDYALTQLNPTPPADGSGIMLSIQFRGKTLGKTTKITSKGNILAVIVGPQKVAPAPFKWKDGALTIVPPKPATPTPAPTPAQIVLAEPVATETAAPENVSAPRGSPDNLLFDIVLVTMACGGFGGALVVLAIAAFVIFRRSRRSAGDQVT